MEAAMKPTARHTAHHWRRRICKYNQEPGWKSGDPFTIFPEVAELYAKRAEELKKIVADKYAAKAEWAKANPEKAAKLAEFFSGKPRK